LINILQKSNVCQVDEKMVYPKSLADIPWHKIQRLFFPLNAFTLPVIICNKSHQLFYRFQQSFIENLTGSTIFSMFYVIE
jgi:hypothetical protein